MWPLGPSRTARSRTDNQFGPHHSPWSYFLASPSNIKVPSFSFAWSASSLSLFRHHVDRQRLTRLVDPPSFRIIHGILNLPKVVPSPCWHLRSSPIEGLSDPFGLGNTYNSRGYPRVIERELYCRGSRSHRMPSAYGLDLAHRRQHFFVNLLIGYPRNSRTALRQDATGIGSRIEHSYSLFIGKVKEVTCRPVQ